MRNPFVSILIPSYRTTFLSAALESIAASTSDNYEVLVARDPVVDRTMDGSAAQVADKLNRLASIARGRYLLVLPDDDILFPYSLGEFQKMAASHGYPDVVYSAKTRITARGEPMDIWPCHPWTREAFQHHNPVEGWTGLVSAATWMMAGGCDPTQVYQDWMFWRACWRAGATACRTSVPLWGNRIHAEQAQPNDPLHIEAWRRMRVGDPELWG